MPAYAKMAGHFFQSSNNAFPDTEYFRGFMEPCRFEGEVYDLETIGEIPKEINGTFYRNMPDPQVAPFARDDIVIQCSPPICSGNLALTCC